MTVDEKERYLNNAMEQHGDYLKRLIFTYVKDIQKAEDIVKKFSLNFIRTLNVLKVVLPLRLFYTVLP